MCAADAITIAPAIAPGPTSEPAWPHLDESESSPAAATSPASTRSSRASSTGRRSSATRCMGIRRGWEGLTHQRRGPELDPEYVRVLDRINTRTIDRTGGTILHSSRTNPRKMRTAALPAWLDPKTVADKQTSEGVYDLTDHVLDTIEHLGLSQPRDHRRRRHPVLLVGPVRARPAAWSRSPRRWTTTSTGPSTASASRPRSRGRRRSSTASARRSGRTSASACSASSAATPASPPCTRRT